MKTTEEAFWAKVNKAPGLGPEGSCWEWTASACRGVGQFSANGKTRRAPQVAYELGVATITDGQFARAHCGNSLCVNPAHLHLTPNAHTGPKPESYYIGKFWAKVDKSAGYGPWGDCWEWQSAKSDAGYGNAWNGKRQIGAHRYAYELTNGPFPKGLFACRRCDNPKCVNPAHIFPGTPKANVEDMHAKGRAVTNGYDKRTHCLRGHLLGGDNLRKTRNGTRQCKQCSSDWSRAKRQRVKEAAAAKQ